MDITQIQAALEAQLAGADNWTEEDWAEFEAECGEGEES